MDGFLNDKSKIFLERRPSKIKFAAEILRKNIIKTIFFVKKKAKFFSGKDSAFQSRS